MAFLLALRINGKVFSSLRKPLAAVLRTVSDTVKDYHLPKEGERGDRSALGFEEEWLDPSLSLEELLDHFWERFSHASDDPMVTGFFFLGMR